MNTMTAVVLIVAIGTFAGLYRARLKVNSQKTDKDFEDLSRRVSRLEDRIANLETLVLEKEKSKQFSDL
jgi:hypothetical protein